MVAAARWFLGRTTTTRYVLAALVLCLLIGVRWFWIDCDGGTPSLMEYGYFATDEGYYTGGGKQKLLYDRFISVIRAAPCTYGICPSSHQLTWLAFSIFGQTTWAHRVFPLLISTLAWLVTFLFLSRRTPPKIAFLLCACCLINPFLTVYGRTACNDTLMSSLLLVGYVVTRKKGWLFSFLGGCLFGLGLWIKQSIWVLFPLGLSAAATAYTPRDRFRRMAAFMVGFVVSACVQYGLIRWSIYEDAVAQNVTVSQLLAISNSSYSLPNPFDWDSTLKGFSSFPRSPSDGLLGLWIPLFAVLPALLLLRRLFDTPFRWDGRLILYATLVCYTAGISILPVFYAHYYIPLIAFVPILWIEARHDLKLWARREHPVMWVLLGVALLWVLISSARFNIARDEATSLNVLLANAYNLPQQIVWCRNGFYILAAAALLTLVGLWGHARKTQPQVVVGLFISALGVADICYVQLLLSEAYKFTPIFTPTMKSVARVLQVASVVLFFAVWCLPGTLRRSLRWYLLLLLLFVGGTLANPVWRNGTLELTQRGHLRKDAIAELARLVPENAVVFGERAPQLFLSLKPRVAPLPNGNPVPTVLAVHKKYPEIPLFAVIDAEHNYHFTHYQENKDKIQLQVVHTLRLPSFNTGLPSDVFLVRLWVQDVAAATPQLKP
jgi:4-amino-4-deoxy-L-arabinose transferase-like glycosyltransferase